MSRMRGLRAVALPLLIMLGGSASAASHTPESTADAAWGRLWTHFLKRLAAAGPDAAHWTGRAQRTSPCVDPYGQPCQPAPTPPTTGTRL